MSERHPALPAPPARAATRLSAALALAVLAAGCGPDEDPAPEPRLLEIDGITITFEELQPYYDWLTSYRPELGVRTKYVWAMREHVLPLKLAQREFAEQRREQLALAEGLCSVATNIQELEQHSQLITDKTRSNLTRQSALLPVAMFLFDELTLNAVSPPIELPHGIFVVSAFERFESQLVMADYVDALQVGFLTHTALEWEQYWRAKRQEIGKQVTFVHPDYRDDMPDWIELPKPNKP
ncbi:MAG: hypothetical protein KAI24_20870 [Planctomycetes bacterium]|nr:hypothetical protein [Planctomycetota bacterium]